MEKNNIKKVLLYLICFSFLSRVFLAWYLELGNDEVYYCLYAAFPALSHFDHPPMVGYFIQLFSLNLLLKSEVFMRLPAIITGTLNIYIVYKIGEKIMNPRAGLISSFLFTASVYASIISGTFIMPDTPMLVFFLSALYIFILILPSEITKFSRRLMLLAGLLIGAGMLSKYTSAVLWLGAMIFILFKKRNWLKTKELYLAFLISIIVFMPVIIWNIENNFISFTFQGERVGIFSSGFHLNYFVTELAGEILYNNPVNVIIIIITLFHLKKFKSNYSFLILSIALPMIFIFMFFSLFRQTLPHWTGPGYTILLILSGVYFSEKKNFPKIVIISLLLLTTGLSLAVVQLKTGFINLDRSESKPANELGSDDVTLDMYGWKQLEEKFELIHKSENIKNMISYRWFPAANLDYYIAGPLGIKMIALGDIGKIHKYYWINEKRGGLLKGENAYFLDFSRDYKNPNELFRDKFNEIILTDTITIMRYKKPAYYVYVYKMTDYNP